MEKKEKQGLTIGFLTDGNIPVEWMMRLKEIESGVPSGMYWRYEWVKGKDFVKNNGGWAKARNEIVNRTMKAGSRYLLFLDTDVLPDPSVLAKMFARLSDEVKIVTGVYYMKTYPPQPILFKHLGDGPYYNFPVESFFEVEGAGLGICLIDTDVFDKFDEKEIPYFKENWIDTKPNGAKVSVKIGEDHWYFKNAKALGFKIMCDSSLLCDHIDIRTGICFPGEEEVQRIRKLVLEKQGKKEELVKQDELYSVGDASKKTIVFYAPYATEFSGDELERRGVGGTETAVINLAKILSEKFNVIVFSNNPRPGIYNGVKYLHISDTEYMKTFKTDLLVVLRNAKLLKDVDFREDFKVGHIALWMHDIVASPAFEGIEQAKFDTLICVSDWHRNEVLTRFKIDPNKVIVLRNGVDNSLFKDQIERVPGKLIYSSTPFRGLDKLLEVFPKIREQVPEANLTVCSSMQIYGKGYTDEWKHLYKKAQEMEGVIYLGSIPQKDLIKEIKSSMITAYYNTYPETGYIGGIMSVTAGTPVVTSNSAGIPEAIHNDTSWLIDSNPESDSYKKEFVKIIVELLKNKDEWNRLSNNCKLYDFDWRLRAKDWINTFFSKENININTKEYWDKQYKFEVENNYEWQRIDTTRWDIIIKEIKDNDKVLEVGMGTGRFMDYLSKKKPNCIRYGIDISEYANKIALERGSVNYAMTDIPKETYFDCIIMQHVIEHLDNPLEFIKKHLCALDKNGTLILVVPINDSEWPEHQKIYQLDNFEELLKSTGMDYNVIHRKNTCRIKKNGEPVQEALAFLKYKEVK